MTMWRPCWLMCGRDHAGPGAGAGAGCVKHRDAAEDGPRSEHVVPAPATSALRAVRPAEVRGEALRHLAGLRRKVFARSKAR